MESIEGRVGAGGGRELGIEGHETLEQVPRREGRQLQQGVPLLEQTQLLQTPEREHRQHGGSEAITEEEGGGGRLGG